MPLYSVSNGRVTNTWANRPTNPVSGDRFYATDLNREFVFDGGVWGFSGNKPFIQCNIPLVLGSEGTIAADGTLTLTTAILKTWTGCWMYFPAGAVVGGQAGMYWVVMSTNTVGSVKNVYADPSQPFLTPYVPSGTPAAAVGSGAAYVLPYATSITLANLTIPGGLMGPNGKIRQSVLSVNDTGAGTKNVFTKYAADIERGGSNTTTAQTLHLVQDKVINLGSTNLNAIANWPALSATATAVAGAVLLNTDTTVNQQIQVIARIPAATSSVAILNITYEVLPA